VGVPPIAVGVIEGGGRVAVSGSGLGQVVERVRVPPVACGVPVLRRRTFPRNDEGVETIVPSGSPQEQVVFE
jgi:hypothetical protein